MNKVEERHYKVLKNEPYGTWRIEELWDSGTIRSPFITAEEAIEREELIAEVHGFTLVRDESK